MSDLVGNPEDRFSHVEAHFITDCSTLVPDTTYQVSSNLLRKHARAIYRDFFIRCKIKILSEIL